jgi:hypothetical protein
MKTNCCACLTVSIILISAIWGAGPKASPISFRLLPGYYVPKNGDTVFCDIDFRDQDQNRSTVSVRVNGANKIFTPEDISAFGVTGYADFRTATVTYHPQPISGTDFPNEFLDSVETRNCFLRVLVDGSYSLYELRTPERYVFFVGTKGNDITELVYRVKRVDQTIQEDQQFRNLLLDYFKQEGLAEQNLISVNRANYNRSEIRRLVELLNRHRTGKPTPRHKKETSLQMDAMIGGVFQSFTSGVNAQYSANDKFASQFSPIGGLNLLCRLPVHFGSLAVGASVGYFEFQSSVDESGTAEHYESANYHFNTVYQEHIWVKRSQLQVNLYVMYIFNPLSKTKFYLKGGIFQHFALSANNDIYDHYTSKTTGERNGVIPISDSLQSTVTVSFLNNSYLNANLGAGIMAGRHRLELITTIPQGNIGQGTIPFRIGMVGLNYYFALIK